MTELDRKPLNRTERLQNLSDFCCPQCLVLSIIGDEIVALRNDARGLTRDYCKHCADDMKGKYWKEKSSRKAE